MWYAGQQVDYRFFTSPFSPGPISHCQPSSIADHLLLPVPSPMAHTIFLSNLTSPHHFIPASNISRYSLEP